ncbi:MAG TPA: glycosyltransferase family 4 protein [Casimicrobiaceae bacterium]|nr:glycosyltransferase family 4 protein [Casimicrobiaceae bacterium]
MNIAFYAPLKPVDHPVPSGDRQLARALLRALAAGRHDVAVASRLRSYDAHGDTARQARIARIGARCAQRLLARWQADRAHPDLWFTYHLHHKAPDWLGPAVCRALDIPYVVAEASIAPRQHDGAWAQGYAASVAAIEAADAVIFVNPHDVPAVQRVRGVRAADLQLAPFIDIDAFVGTGTRAAPVSPPRAGRVRLACVAMMREGAKLASYRLLAHALAALDALDWDLVVVGDGPARAAVEGAFAGLARDRIHFAGALDAAGVTTTLRGADVFVWPAVDEAFGMAFIEAQACGLPVVAGNAGGVAAVIDAGRSGLLVAPGDAPAFAAAVRRLVTDDTLRAAMAAHAPGYVRARHDLPVAARALDATLRGVAAARARLR